MTLSRREFIELMGGLIGGGVLALADFSEAEAAVRCLAAACGPTDLSVRLLAKLGAFNATSPDRFQFDEGKYGPRLREIERPEWKATNRHLPIAIPSEVRNRPGERSPEALAAVVAYTGFEHPRYVAQPGERASMCNIAAWDWSRGLQVHLPHWMGETEMSANMLARWIAQPGAGGVYGEGWQPVDARAAQLLADRGVPVFALAENPSPGRHGHVALVYPREPEDRALAGAGTPVFATVKSGRGRRSNGIMGLSSAFRWLAPSYYVHRSDFVVHR